MFFFVLSLFFLKEVSRVRRQPYSYPSFFSRVHSLFLALGLPVVDFDNGKLLVVNKSTVWIFITALKIICDSRLDEHEAFLQLPCRLMWAGIDTLNLNK